MLDYGVIDYDDPFTLRRLQDEQETWVQHNFPNRTSYQPLLGVIEEVGELAGAHLRQSRWDIDGDDEVRDFLYAANYFGVIAHCLLKTRQGIRGDRHKHFGVSEDALCKLLVSLRRVFGDDMFSRVQKDANCIPAKWSDGPTGGDVDDAVADITIFLSDYASSMDIDYQGVLEQTWNKVKTRDWVAYPEKGRP